MRLAAEGARGRRGPRAGFGLFPRGAALLRRSVRSPLSTSPLSALDLCSLRALRLYAVSMPFFRIPVSPRSLFAFPYSTRQRRRLFAFPYSTRVCAAVSSHSRTLRVYAAVSSHSRTVVAAPTRRRRCLADAFRLFRLLRHSGLVSRVPCYLVAWSPASASCGPLRCGIRVID